ncbi:hypothetical protein Raf01_89810 [Rugosimonospora africana]|uniref:Uncharacterized protein n=2 Tax=Rugosimonospora africana TaxID=556532 RepID=A0A8J3R0L3_9ACTN|nr:hypothetical protein Raf01_89810 [Rugosimonospora africana]
MAGDDSGARDGSGAATVPDGQVRRCGYGQCGRALDYDGRGRPPEYCPDRRWEPGGRSCRQMAAAARVAERAAGLDGPLDSFRATGSRVIAAAEPLAGQLTDLLTAIAEVRDGALTRIGEAESASTAADQRAAAAQVDTDRATRAAQQAETDRDVAQADARRAEQRAEAARRDAEEQVRRAWDRVAEADRSRGQAEAAGALATAGQAEEVRRREAADQRAAAALADRDGVRAELHAAHAVAADLRTQLASAGARADLAATEAAHLREQLTALRTELDALREQQRADADRARALADEFQAAAGQRDAAAAEASRLAADTDRLGRDLVAATDATTAAVRRAERAETLVDRLAAALPAAVAPATTASDTTASAPEPLGGGPA